MNALLSSQQVVSTPDVRSFLLVGMSVLIAIGAILTMRAHRASASFPDLKLQVCFPSSPPNRPGFLASRDESLHGLKTISAEQTIATLSLRNRSAFSARNPTVIIRFNAMAHLPRYGQDADPGGETAIVDQSPSEWVTIEVVDSVGITAMQWDGGRGYSIHGFSTRRLPRLNLHRLYHYPHMGDPEVTVELTVKDGYSRRLSIPVRFLTDEEWSFQQQAVDSNRPQTSANEHWL
jgi:hypothetical protein